MTVTVTAADRPMLPSTRVLMQDLRGRAGTWTRVASDRLSTLSRDVAATGREVRTRTAEAFGRSAAATRARAASAPFALRQALLHGLARIGFAPLARLVARHPTLAWCLALPVIGHAIFGVLMTGIVPVILTLFFALLALIPANQAARELMAGQRRSERRRGSTPHR